jgi:hypothetical protein
MLATLLLVHWLSQGTKISGAMSKLEILAMIRKPSSFVPKKVIRNPFRDVIICRDIGRRHMEGRKKAERGMS